MESALCAYPFALFAAIEMNGAASRPVFAERLGRLHRDPVVLTAFLAIIVASFVLTSLFVGRYKDKEAAIARHWFDLGEAALQSSQPELAVDDFQNALAYSRNNDAYRLHLAQALIAAQRPQEARSHLLSLVEAEPGDGFVNLELARLAARAGQAREAQRYYHAAIYGVWPQDPVNRRIRVRFELSQFLLDNHQIARAEAELLELRGVLPADEVELHLRLANLLTKTGDDRAALEEFREVLAREARSHQALAGAGEAAFRLQDYAQAEQYLRRAVAEQSQDRHSAELLEVATQVRELDPYVYGLRSKERADRALRDFEIAMRRLQQCTQGQAPSAVTQALQQGKQVEPKLRRREMSRNPDLVNTTMSWVFQSEIVAQQPCGALSAEDRALLLLAGRYPAGKS